MNKPQRSRSHDHSALTRRSANRAHFRRTAGSAVQEAEATEYDKEAVRQAVAEFAEEFNKRTVCEHCASVWARENEPLADEELRSLSALDEATVRFLADHEPDALLSDLPVFVRRAYNIFTLDGTDRDPVAIDTFVKELLAFRETAAGELAIRATRQTGPGQQGPQPSRNPGIS